MKKQTFITSDKTKSILGALFLIIPVFFLEQTTVCGFCSILGLSFLYWGGKTALTKSGRYVNLLAVWIAHSVRFATFFGSHFLFAFLISLCFIPYSAAIFGSFLLTQRINRLKLSFLSVLVFPIAYTLLAFILSTVNLGLVSNVTGYLMVYSPFTHSLSCLGEYGMTFFFTLILSFIITVFDEKRCYYQVVCASLAFLLTFVPLLTGIIQSKKIRTPDFTINVAMATSQEMDFLGESETTYGPDRQIQAFRNALAVAAQQQADLLVLNEEYSSVDAALEETLYTAISGAVAEYGIPVLAGIELLRTEGLSVNEAVYFNANGTAAYTYLKNNLVPFVESGYYVDGEEKPANLTTAIGGHDVNVSFVICSDVNDAAYMHKISPATELLLIPSWDWNTENVEQLRTGFRAAVLDVTMVKHSFEGFSFIATPYGTAEQTVDFRGQYETVVTVRVPIYQKAQ